MPNTAVKLSSADGN